MLRTPTQRERLTIKWLLRAPAIVRPFIPSLYSCSFVKLGHCHNYATAVQLPQPVLEKLVTTSNTYRKLVALLNDLRSQHQHQPHQLFYSSYVLDLSITDNQLHDLLEFEIQQLDHDEIVVAISNLIPYCRVSQVARTILLSVLSHDVRITPAMLSTWIPYSTDTLCFRQLPKHEERALARWYMQQCSNLKTKLKKSVETAGTNNELINIFISKLESDVHALVRTARWIPIPRNSLELRQALEKSCQVLCSSTDLLIWRSQYIRPGQELAKAELRACRVSGCHFSHPLELIKALHDHGLKEEAVHAGDQLCEEIRSQLLMRPVLAIGRRMQKNLTRHDLTYLIPGLKFLVSSLYSNMSKEIRDVLRNTWDILLIPNLNQLTINEKLGALELLSSYKLKDIYEKTVDENSPLNGRSVAEETCNEAIWIEKNWISLWDSVSHSNDSFDLFTVTQLFKLCDNLMPLSKPPMPSRYTLTATIHREDLFAVLARATSTTPIEQEQRTTANTTPKKSYIQYQLDMFPVLHLLSLSSNLAQLLLIPKNQTNGSLKLESASKLLEACLSALDGQSINGLGFGNHSFYFDCLHLALLLDPVRNASLSNKLLHILVYPDRLKLLGNRRRHFIFCQIYSRPDYWRSDIGNLILEALKETIVPYSEKECGYIVNDLLTLSSEQAWHVFCCWSCKPLMFSMRNPEYWILFEEVQNFLLRIPEIEEKMITASKRYPLLELPDALADALDQASNPDVATLIRTAKLVQHFPFSVSGTIRLFDVLIRQINQTVPASPLQSHTIGSSYDKFMVELIQSRVSHYSLLYNWINKRIVPLFWDFVTHRNLKHLPLWLANIEEMGVSSPSLRRCMEQSLSSASKALDIQWLYMGHCFQISTSTLQSRMWALLETLSGSQANPSLDPIDLLRLYSMHIDLSLKLKSAWTDKVKSNSAIYQYLHNHPLLEWIRQQENDGKSFHESISYQSLKASLMRLSSDGAQPYGSQFKSEMKDVLFIDFFLESSSNGPIAILCIQPKNRFKLLYNPTETQMLKNFEIGLDCPYDVSSNTNQHPTSLRKHRVFDDGEETLILDFLKPSARSKHDRLRAMGWTVVLVDLDQYHSKERINEQECDLYLKRCFQDHVQGDGSKTTFQKHHI